MLYQGSTSKDDTKKKKKVRNCHAVAKRIVFDTRRIAQGLEKQRDQIKIECWASENRSSKQIETRKRIEKSLKADKQEERGC